LSWIKRNTPPNKRIYLFQMLLGKIMQDELISKIIAESINTLDSKTELIETIPKSKIEPVKSKKIEKEKRFINKEVNVYNNSNQNEEYLIKPEQIKISNLSFYSKNDRIIKMMKKKQNYAYVLNRYSRKTSIISINKSNPKETLITIAIPIRKNNDWFLVNKEFRIIDKRTQDQYLIRKIEKNLPLDRKIIITGNAEKMIEITMIFPPLKKNVEVVDIIEKNEKNDGWLFENVNINDYSVVNAGKVYR